MVNGEESLACPRVTIAVESSVGCWCVRRTHIQSEEHIISNAYCEAMQCAMTGTVSPLLKTKELFLLDAGDLVCYQDHDWVQWDKGR